MFHHSYAGGPCPAYVSKLYCWKGMLQMACQRRLLGGKRLMKHGVTMMGVVNGRSALS
jgi:hypothetical protein